VADRMVWAAGGWPGGGGPAAAGQGSVPVRRGVPLGTVGARPGRGAAPLPHVLEATAHAHRLRAVPDRAVQVLAIVAAVLLRWASAQLVILPGVATTCQHHCGQSRRRGPPERRPGTRSRELNSVSQPSQNWLHACATVSEAATLRPHR
jgi:hypothetical protein